MKQLKIDIVSDVVCPWCAIGYGNLNQALTQLEDTLSADITWHPFQLNPCMGKEGQDINEHLMEKYGLTDEQLIENKGRIKEAGEKAGVEFNFDQRSRTYNSFDCHVLLHYGLEKGKQTELKEALFKAYFTEGKDISDRQVLVDVAKENDLNPVEVQIVLNDENYRKTVQDEESKYKHMGINAVPAFIINDKYIINGGQPVEAFVQGLQDIVEREQ